MMRTTKRNAMIGNRLGVVIAIVHIAITINHVVRRVAVHNVVLLIGRHVMIVATIVIADVVLRDGVRVLHADEVAESRRVVVGARHPEIVVRNGNIHREGVHQVVEQINPITTIIGVHLPLKWMVQQPQMRQGNPQHLLINFSNNNKIMDHHNNNNNHKIQEWFLRFKITNR